MTFRPCSSVLRYSCILSLRLSYVVSEPLRHHHRGIVCLILLEINKLIIQALPRFCGHHACRSVAPRATGLVHHVPLGGRDHKSPGKFQVCANSLREHTSQETLSRFMVYHLPPPTHRRREMPMPSDEDVTQRAGSLCAMTGLAETEFQALLPHFEQAFETYLGTRTIDGHPRTSRRYSPYVICPLLTMADQITTGSSEPLEKGPSSHVSQGEARSSPGWPTVFLLGETTCERRDARYLVQPGSQKGGALAAFSSPAHPF
jgi:hypothetical protein